MPRAFSQASKWRVARQFDGSVIAGVDDHAAHARGGRHVDGLDVLLVGADIADMREGEGDDLPGIGGIGQDLLVARHRGVEADLAGRLADRADAEALEHRAVGQHEQGGGAGLVPAVAPFGAAVRWPDLEASPFSS